VVSALEGGQEGRVYSSGMAALSAAVLGHLRQGDEVVAPEDLYGNTLTLLKEELPRWGITVRLVPPGGTAPVERYVSERTRLLLVESPTNPTLRVHDLRAWARAAGRANAWLLVDNTFATPLNQRPLGLGAQVVMHSATKYLGGHSDLLAGALVSGRGLLSGLDRFSGTLGGTLDPLAGFLLLRGMKTLPLRVARHNENARAVVEELEGHPKIASICYPGRNSDEEERICRRQMRGRGGMVSLVLRGGLKEARRFLRGLSLFQVASSLGGVESLVSLPLETSHRAMSREERARIGIADSMARLSLGIEDAADLVADLQTALRMV
jgi:cystathionine beta-lyase/cystathionine gamma-synthase